MMVNGSGDLMNGMDVTSASWMAPFVLGHLCEKMVKHLEDMIGDDHSTCG
jgi:hypothetical protein